VKAFCAAVYVLLVSAQPAFAEDESRPDSGKGGVLVELFTSEGCSSCPPAEALLEELAQAGGKDAPIIVPLAFHVDYWNHLGWADPFSRQDFTRRQYEYASAAGAEGVYTPQMIVNGVDAFVGSDHRRAETAIAKAAATPKAALTIDVHPLASNGIEVHIQGEGFASTAERPTVYVAITEDNLQSDVPRGENAGKTLHHIGVVRWFESLEAEWKEDGTLITEVKLPLKPDWNRENLKVVAFAQDLKSRRVDAVASQPIT
jgi:hypothetical protein